MSEENLEIVKAAMPPSNTDLCALFADDPDAARRIEAAAPLFHPEFEFQAHGGVAERTAGRGFPALVEAWREWLKPFESFRTEVERYVPVDDDRILVVLRDHPRPRGTDAEFESLGCNVWTLRDEQVARIDFYPTRRQGFEAAGLRE